jgi:hypothetical protein
MVLNRYYSFQPDLMVGASRARRVWVLTSALQDSLVWEAGSTSISCLTVHAPQSDSSKTAVEAMVGVTDFETH